MSSTLASSPPVSPTASEPPLEFFQTAWTLQLNEDFSQIGDWSLTELALKQIEWQLRIHKEQILLRETEYGAFRKAQNARNVGAASLLSMCTQDIIDLLEASDNLFDDVAVVAESLNASAITEIVRDPRTPYLALRIFHGLPPNFGPANAAETARSAVDLDEAILVNERYLRARGPDRNLDRRALLNLDDIDVLLGLPPVEEGSSARVLVRKDPPAGGFEFLDTQRPRQIQIQPSTAAFVETFHRITGGILKGLNWENVFVAGGMVLTTLLHLDPSKDSLKKVRDCDVDIYIYGLNSVQANQKVEEIYNVWTSNLPAGAEKLVVKNAKTINFLSKYPTRRLQIVLKLAPHPTSILLNFDLDPCAMGFDGKQVTMLPRCVRALETGYSTFTMDLIWGHHLEDRRATQEQRVFKYASRGFGIRILPCYVSCLEQNIDSLAALYRSTGPNEQARKPDGPEPGLKTMKRIALLGRDMVHRFYYGISELARCPEWEDVNEWNNRFRQAMRTAKDKVKKNVKRIQEGLDPIVPLIKISDLDSRGIHPHFPGGRKGVGGFEQWMRHCEAWRLDQIREAKTDMDKLSSLVYDIQAYDDMPKYEWDPSFNMDTLAVRIEDYNDKIFRTAKKLICAKLHIEYRQTGWKDYLTRRLRRMVHGPDLDKVMEKQITLPLCLSDDFERTMTRFLDEAIEETDWLPQESKSIPPIIQMHTEGVGTEIVPDLIETLESEGNMRIWVISNELMWAGVDRRIDEVFEVLWTAYHWLSTPSEPVMDGDEMIYFFGTRLRTRYSSSLKQQSRATIISGDDADQPETPTPLSVAPTEDPGLPYRGATARRPQREQKPLGVLSPQEAQYFQSWVFCYPEKITRHYTEGTYHELYDEGEVIYPPPDELFWSSDDQEAVSKNYLGVKEWKSFKMTETEATDAAAISPRHSGFSYGSAGCAAVGDAEDLRQRLGMKKKGVPKTTGVAVDIGMEDFDLDDSGSEDGGLAASPMDVSAG